MNGLIPMVETFVDLPEVLHGHYRALGGWSFAFEDYYREGNYHNILIIWQLNV